MDAALRFNQAQTQYTMSYILSIIFFCINTSCPLVNLKACLILDLFIMAANKGLKKESLSIGRKKKTQTNPNTWA